jgi:hypothetical protein
MLHDPVMLRDVDQCDNGFLTVGRRIADGD